MRSLITLSITLVLALNLLAPAAAGAAESATTSRPEASVEDEFVRTINRERADHGLPELRVSLQQHRKAREHAQLMRDTDHLHHPSSLAAQVFPDGAWGGIAENVARHRSVEGAHQALMDSPGHRKNLLGDWTHVAVGVAYDGRDLWVTQRFVIIRDGHTLPMFTDMPSSSWKRETVVDAWRAGLLAGCGGERVCADDPIRRDQMASLLARATDRPDDRAGAARFTDVSSRSTHAGAIGALASDEVTLGCDADRYCPDERLTRAATASLLVRARAWSYLDGQLFEDVGRAHTHLGTINRLAVQGVTDGCSRSRYCPSRAVTRVEVARMLARTF